MRWRIRQARRDVEQRTAQRGQGWPPYAVLSVMQSWLIGVVATLALLLMVSVALTAPIAHADSSVTLTIRFPQPSGDAVEGPVGTNVTIQAQGATPGDSYTLGYALGAKCDTGFQAFSSVPQPSVGQDGSISATFAWPANVANVGASYSICLEDTTQTPPVYAQSQQTFKVDSGSPPSISLSHPSSESGTQLPASQYYAGSQMVITGSNFLPSDTTLTAYVSSGQINSKADLANAQTLNTDSGQSFQPNRSGQFKVTATLPQESIGSATQYYIYVVSSDGSDSAPPSLVASRHFTLVPAPTPTPPTPTATTAPPTPTTQAGTGGGTPPPSHPDNTGAVIGLGALSIVLFIIGVILLASAATSPRAGQR